MNFLGDQFTHSTVTSEAAKDSPTVQLVRYLIDVAHEMLDAGNLTSHATGKVLMNAHNWLKVADEELTDDPSADDCRNVIEQAASVITDLTSLLPGRMSLHSLVINWSDGDAEQGTFGTTVRASGHDHAEYLARAEMEASEDAGSDFTGEVVDHNVGASWKADDLEKALRGMVEACKAGIVATEGLTAALASAQSILAEIDAIA